MAAGPPAITGPSFYITGRQPIRPAAILLAVLIAACGISMVAFGLGERNARHLADSSSNVARSPGSAPGAPPKADEKDDPSQVDTIVLGDAADAPVPARRGDHVSDVHATILIHLPRFGEQTGLIPGSPAGHLLYGWLAAFNQGSNTALEDSLPNLASTSAADAQMNLRHQTGGFNLLSAKEVQPGVLVFRLRDQTPSAGEVLGTLQVRAGSSPAEIAAFSLRAVPSTRQAPSSPTGPAQH